MKISRRQFISGAAVTVGGAMVAERAYDHFSESTVRAKVVIVGGGAGGMTVAAQLCDRLRHPDITVIEPNDLHDYQPGYTLVAADVFTPEEIRRPMKNLMPRHVKWVKDSVEELHPESNEVVTRANGNVSYDFLVLAPGCELDFDHVEGISKETLGEGNAHCIYTLDGAIKCRDAMRALLDRKEGRLLFTDTYSKVKCGGVPKKVCLLTESLLRNHNHREGFQFSYCSASDHLMKPAIFNDRLKTLYSERHIDTQYLHRLVAVDTAAKKAVFQKLKEPAQAHFEKGTGEELVTLDYDFLHFSPPMRAPGFVRNSPLAIAEGSLRYGGWTKADQFTLVQPDFPNIVVLGDAAGIPTSKTAAAIHKQAPVATANLVALMEGKEPTKKYNGYTACPVITEYGKVLLCEFGYDDVLMPTAPLLDPGVERRLWWWLKVYGLKPMYFDGMLKGYV